MSARLSDREWRHRIATHYGDVVDAAEKTLVTVVTIVAGIAVAVVAAVQVLAVFIPSAVAGAVVVTVALGAAVWLLRRRLPARLREVGDAAELLSDVGGDDHD